MHGEHVQEASYRELGLLEAAYVWRVGGGMSSRASAHISGADPGGVLGVSPPPPLLGDPQTS